MEQLLLRARLHASALARAALCASLVAACAPSVSLRVPAEAVAELPLERKLTLLDAENDLLAAVDARDAQEDRVLRCIDAKAAAEEHRRDAEEVLSRAHKANQPAEVGELALAESEARLELASRQIEAERAGLRVSDATLLVAQARFEQARANEVVQAGLAHSNGVKLEQYKEQVDALQRVVEGRAAEAAQRRARADEVAQRWKLARAQLTKATGGAQGSAWVQ